MAALQIQDTGEKRLYKGRKILAVRAVQDRFRLNSIVRALLAALAIISLFLSLLFEKIPRSLMVNLLGLSGYWVGFGMGGS